MRTLKGISVASIMETVIGHNRSDRLLLLASRKVDQPWSAFAMKRRLTVLAAIVALGLFLGLIFLYDPGQAPDSELALAMNADRGIVVTTIMVAASRYGREYFWAGIVAVMLIFSKNETKIKAIELAILFAVGVVAGEVVKQLIVKPRPFKTIAELVTRVPKDYDSSFPSGHAIIVTIGATFALLKFEKKSIAVLLTLEASIVAYSRIYVGMHYPLDVVGGIFLGSAIAFLGVFFLNKKIVVFVEEIVRFVSSSRSKKANAHQLLQSH